MMVVTGHSYYPADPATRDPKHVPPWALTLCWAAVVSAPEGVSCDAKQLAVITTSSLTVSLTGFFFMC